MVFGNIIGIFNCTFANDHTQGFVVGVGFRVIIMSPRVLKFSQDDVTWNMGSQVAIFQMQTTACRP
jgi:hypothetical protein